MVWFAGAWLIGVVKATSTSGISWLKGGRSPMSFTQHSMYGKLYWNAKP